MSGGTIHEDPRLRLAMKECPVHFLNSASDFPAWMVALQRLVTGVSMADSLLYSMPVSEAVEYKRNRLAMADMGPVIPNVTPHVPALVAETPASKQKEKKEKARESKDSIKPDGDSGCHVGCHITWDTEYPHECLQDEHDG